jgi:hypothetical protein
MVTENLNASQPRSLRMLADPGLRGEDTEDWLRRSRDAGRDRS